MSNFRYKWQQTIHASCETEETEKEILFKLTKALVKHDPIELDKSFEITRLHKNIFLIHPSLAFPSGTTKEEMAIIDRVLEEE